MYIQTSRLRNIIPCVYVVSKAVYLKAVYSCVDGMYGVIIIKLVSGGVLLVNMCFSSKMIKPTKRYRI